MNRNVAIAFVAILCVPSALAKSVEEVEMIAGRLTKLPVSHYWSKRIELVRPPGSRRGFNPRFRTACMENNSDTGMLVTFVDNAGSSFTLYNDDGAPKDLGPTPLGNGSGSYVATAISASRRQTQATIYNLTIFSMVRGTSTCDLYIDRGDGQGWRFQESVSAGGTLVRVGPLMPGDYVQIQKPRNASPTRMLLFEVKAPWSSRTPIEVTDAPPQNSTIIDHLLAWDVDTFVLVGLDGPSRVSKTEIEDRIDLVRGPLNQLFPAPFPATGGSGEPIWLNPGRYYFFVTAKLDQPVGSGNTNPSVQMEACSGWPNDNTNFRGQPNDNALTITALAFGGVYSFGYYPLVIRRVPRAVVGGTDVYSRIILEVRVDLPSFFYVSTSDHVPGLRFEPNWTAVRNPNASELKLVSANMYYDDLGFNDNEYRNAANLFATRGTVIPRTGNQPGRVEERPDQAPFQLDADIIAMQEVVKKCVGSNCYKEDGRAIQEYYPAWDYYEKIFRDEADARGTLRWNYVTGRDEFYELFSTGGKGPIFVNSNNWPDRSDPNSMYFSAEAKRASQCQYNFFRAAGPPAEGPLGYAECVMSGGDWSAYYRAIPAKIAVHRYHTDYDRPISVFNVHPTDDGYDFVARNNEFGSLIERIRALMRNDPRAFSPYSNPDDVRIIVIGDFNTRQRECGEQYWIVRKFREEFGYAVDVSMAVDGSVERHLSAHDQGAYDSSGIPVGWESFEHWKGRGAPLAADSAYPWWSMTTRGKLTEGLTGKESAELLDHILLVGRGWAKDDAVRIYTILSDRHDPSPLDSSGRAIEMWRPLDVSQPRCPAGIVRDGDPNSYNPNYPLDPARAIGVRLPACGIGPGKPALHTDHRPITAALRIF